MQKAAVAAHEIIPDGFVRFAIEHPQWILACIPIMSDIKCVPNVVWLMIIEYLVPLIITKPSLVIGPDCTPELLTSALCSLGERSPTSHTSVTHCMKPLVFELRDVSVTFELGDNYPLAITVKLAQFDAHIRSLLDVLYRHLNVWESERPDRVSCSKPFELDDKGEPVTVEMCYMDFFNECRENDSYAEARSRGTLNFRVQSLQFLINYRVHNRYQFRSTRITVKYMS